MVPGQRGRAAMEGRWSAHLRELYGSDDLSDAVVLLATPEQAKAARAAQADAAAVAASAAPWWRRWWPGRVADRMLAHGKPIAAHSVVLCMSPVWRASLLSGVGQVDATASGKMVRWRIRPYRCSGNLASGPAPMGRLGFGGCGPPQAPWMCLVP